MRPYYCFIAAITIYIVQVIYVVLLHGMQIEPSKYIVLVRWAVCSLGAGDGAALEGYWSGEGVVGEW